MNCDKCGRKSLGGLYVTLSTSDGTEQEPPLHNNMYLCNHCISVQGGPVLNQMKVEILRALNPPKDPPVRSTSRLSCVEAEVETLQKKVYELEDSHQANLNRIHQLEQTLRSIERALDAHLSAPRVQDCVCARPEASRAAILLEALRREGQGGRSTGHGIEDPLREEAREARAPDSWRGSGWTPSKTGGSSSPRGPQQAEQRSVEPESSARSEGS